MTLDDLISHYGLIALFVGCFFEGETVAIAGGVMAHRHLLVLWQVIAVVVSAAFLADLTAFTIGRRFSNSAVVRRILARPVLMRVMAQVEEHPRKLASLFRFIPGMRILGPVALAQSPLPAAVFALHAAVSAVVWGVMSTVLGHAIAEVLVRVVGEEKHKLLPIAAALVVVGVVAHLAWRRFGKRNRL
jgi:membrane protein DedA with SNARE-associated domain